MNTSILVSQPAAMHFLIFLASFLHFFSVFLEVTTESVITSTSTTANILILNNNSEIS